MQQQKEHFGLLRQGDERVCFTCGKRWHYAEEPPQCDVTFYCADPVSEQILADEKIMLGLIEGYWSCTDQYGIQTIVYSEIDKIKFMNRYPGAVCTWVGETR